MLYAGVFVHQLSGSIEDIMEIIEEKNRNNLFLNDNTANPAPLGLCAFGMTTILLSLHNAGLTALGSPILAMAVFYGGIAQVIARHYGMEEEQYVWHGHLWQFRVFLDLVCYRTDLPPALGLVKAPRPG